MGAWSHEPFGNDTACDWICSLLETNDLSFIEEALDAVAEVGEDCLEADMASEAIAAIEVLAKLLGRGTQADSYTRDVDEWVKKHSLKPGAALLTKAQQVLKRIQSPDSELLELWDEGEDTGAWKESLQQLASAISA